jgi:uncharacterized protein (DUF1330 family)
MNVENALYPGPTGLTALMAEAHSGPIVMVNLLKFRDEAAYPDGRPERVSGAEAFQRYADAMRGIVEGAGGRFVFAADVRGVIIGDVDAPWDAVGLVEYPSVAAFRRIATSPEVQAVAIHREAGLAGQLLIMTVQR